MVWRSENSWRILGVCVVRRAVRVSQRSSEIGAEQNPWNGRNEGLKAWVVTWTRMLLVSLKLNVNAGSFCSNHSRPITTFTPPSQVHGNTNLCILLYSNILILEGQRQMWCILDLRDYIQPLWYARCSLFACWHSLKSVVSTHHRC